MRGISVMVEMVKYKNELNRVALEQFTPSEMNLFFAIVSRIRNKEDCVIRFSLKEIRELAQYKPTAANRLIEDLTHTYAKLLKLTYPHTYTKKDQVIIESFNLFKNFEFCEENEATYDSSGEKITAHTGTTLKDGYVDIAVNPHFSCLFNNVFSGFTQFSLSEFISLKSKYAKNMFRLLKQFRSTGYRRFSIVEFRYMLSIPKSYQIGQIDQKIIQRLKQELSPYFKNLTIRKEYARTQGKKVTGYNFYFTPEKIYR
ncbi:hypothetical protein RV18_GL001651 [Enterococcus termitis]|nr:hypothetical protein RV18_GL001651 [Enterococcus termitis]